MIQPPFLLYIGATADPVSIKTSRGLAEFRRADCIGEVRPADAPLSLGLPVMSVAQGAAAGARTLVLGIANAGGVMGEGLVAAALEAVSLGLDVASGLHQRLADQPELVAAAAKTGARLIDVRVPPADLPTGTGLPRAGRRILTVGTDCSVGKMYASLALVKAFAARGVPARFRATGQTGILIAGDGIPLDAVVADFIAGAIEQLAPANPGEGWDVIEGQGSLFHPAFAGVSTGLLHGAQPTALIMCHDPARAHMRHLPHMPMPDLAACIEANLAVARLTSPQVRLAGLAINTSGLPEGERAPYCASLADRFGLPCVDPHSMGADALVESLVAIAP